MKALLLIGIAVIVLVVGMEVAGDDSKPANKPATGPKYSLTDASSPWVVVNKKRPLQPKNYAPAGLVVPDVPLRENITEDEKHVAPRVKKPLEQLVAAARKQNIKLDLQSGYRSYDSQVAVYENFVSEQGERVANMYSAKPGFSEHQTGLAVDFGGATNPACDVTDCFVDTPEAMWLKDNAHKYGFILRYVKGKQSITGYSFEPWHFRYVGTELAGTVYAKNNITLEEYFKLK